MAIYIPFNHMPTATGQNSTTYTVPANKYARVIVHLATTAKGASTSGAILSPGGSSFADFNGIGSTDCNSVSQEFWLRAAETITLTKTAGAANVTVNAGTTGGKIFAGSATAVASAAKSGVDILVSTCIASFSGYVNISGAGGTADIVGTCNTTADGGIYYEEYNVIGT